MEVACGQLEGHDTVHLLKRPSSDEPWTLACGGERLPTSVPRVRSDVDAVTCRQCRRTVAYRELLGATAAGAPDQPSDDAAAAT